MSEKRPRYRTVSSWLNELFGESVRKINLDAGLGCPNRDGSVGTGGCVYCNPRGSGTGAQTEGLSITQQVERGIAFLSKRYKCKKFIAYFQSFTNTYAEVERLARLYREACSFPEIVALAVGTRPDCAPDPVLDLLAEHAQSRLVWIEYGLQSVHSRTLALINRGHCPDAFFDAVTRTNERGLLSVAHLILGLPGESLDDMLETTRAVAAAGAHGVKLHPLYVIEGTQLARFYRTGAYHPMTEEEALNATLAILETLPPEMVIHRMTSDPHANELVAPLWMLDKTGVRIRLNKAMADRDVVQGSRFTRKYHDESTEK